MDAVEVAAYPPNSTGAVPVASMADAVLAMAEPSCVHVVLSVDV